MFKPRINKDLITSGIFTIIIGIIVLLFSMSSSAAECNSCHNIRHGSINTTCENCHYNTTIIDGKHIEKPFLPVSIHYGFDWAGDTNIGQTDPEDKSCPVCHVSMLEHNAQSLNICEDCHVKGNPKESKMAELRPNLTQYIPLVYSHINGSSIEVQDQSVTGNTKSSCFGYDPKTGEGSCHGVTNGNKVKAGGFFAVKENITKLSRGDPYHKTSSLDSLPDSKDCAFCHLQEDAAIRKAWGDPSLLPSDSSHIDKKNNDCWGCHVIGELKSFHGKEMFIVREKSYTIYMIMALVSLLIIIGFYVWKKKK